MLPSCVCCRTERSRPEAWPSSQPALCQRHLVTVRKLSEAILMNRRSGTKLGLWDEILFLGSGVIMFVPLLLMLVVGLTGLNVLR
jgi:hypothetical protein